MATPTTLRGGDIVRIRDERWRIVHYAPYGAAAVIEVEGSDAANRAERARFLLPFERLDRLPCRTVPRVVRPCLWRRAGRHALAGSTPSWGALRTATRANLALIPFQLEPVLALLRGDACRFLIADAVGLGKTAQAGLMIAEVLARSPEARAIVVSPAGLREQWRDELKTRFGLDAEVMDAAAVARIGTRLPQGMNPWSVHSLVITSVDYVKRAEVLRCLEPLVWDVVIFDEAHALAGRSDRALAAEALAGRGRVLVMLTATPHSGDEQAFRRMCRLGDAGESERLLMFRRGRAALGLARPRRSVLLRVRPTSAELALHDALMSYARLVWDRASAPDAAGARLAMSVLARRAASSAASLARSVEHRLALLTDTARNGGGQLELLFPGTSDEDEEPGRMLGAAGLPDRQDERGRLERILELARTAARTESKLAALRRLISRTNEPAIVFTEYRDTLEMLAAALGGIDLVLLHGGLTPGERAHALRRFTDGPARLLLATDAASEGLNLHRRCRLVVNLELPWTPVRLEQRAGRVDRIGQAARVHALHLVARGTAEETVLARLALRIARIQRAFEALETLPDDGQVAEAVLGNRSLLHTAPMPGPSAGGDVVTADLRSEASAEATRIGAAREWLEPHGWIPPARPVVTRIRRRPACVSPPQCFWVFRLLFTAEDQQVVAEELLAVRAVTGRRPARSRVAMRSLLDPWRQELQQVVNRESGRRLSDVEAVLCRPVDRWLARERALMAAARERHARLAAGLVHYGLFDRRPERLAAAQSAVLEETLSRSATRSAQLSAWRTLQVDSCDLVLAVVVE